MPHPTGIGGWEAGMQQGCNFPGVSLGSCEVGTAGNGREPLPNLPSFPPALLLCVLSQELLLGWDQPWEDPRKSLEVSIPKVWDPSLGSIPRIWHPFQHSEPRSLVWSSFPRSGIYPWDLGSIPRIWDPAQGPGVHSSFWDPSFGSGVHPLDPQGLESIPGVWEFFPGSGAHLQDLGSIPRMWSPSLGSRVHSQDLKPIPRIQGPFSGSGVPLWDPG